MDSNGESVYRPRPEGSEMAPGGSPKDGGTMADNSRMVHPL